PDLKDHAQSRRSWRSSPDPGQRRSGESSPHSSAATADYHCFPMRYKPRNVMERYIPGFWCSLLVSALTICSTSRACCRKQRLRLEAPNLTRRSRAALRRFAADNPAHRRIVAQALGVVHILVSGKATKYRLPEQPGQCVPTILATACVGQNITRHLGQTEYV